MCAAALGRLHAARVIFTCKYPERRLDPKDSMSGKHINISVDDDATAERVLALLEVLGYSASRCFGADGDDSYRLAWRLRHTIKRYNLTESEADVLTRVVDGQTTAEIADERGVSAATVKWHLHNLFVKTGTANREALLRCVLLGAK